MSGLLIAILGGVSVIVVLLLVQSNRNKGG